MLSLPELFLDERLFLTPEGTMDTQQRAVAFREALEAFVRRMGLPGPFPGYREELDAALQDLLSPVCSERDCRQTDYLVRCASCGQLACQRHVERGTLSDGEVADVCFTCRPGPDPREY